MKRRDLTRYLVTLSLLLSFCSFSYQLLIANVVVMLTGGAIFWQSITIGAYLGGLGVGTYFASRSNSPNAWRSLTNVELSLSICGMSAVALVLAAHVLYRVGFQSGVAWLVTSGGILDYEAYETARSGGFVLFIGCAQAIVGGIGILTGFEIPLLIGVGGERQTNAVIGFNYLGSLLATLIYSFALYPNFEPLEIGLLIGTLNLLLCIVISLECEVFRLPKVKLVIGLIVVIGVALAASSSAIQQGHLKVFYHFRAGELAPSEALNSSLAPANQSMDLPNFAKNELVTTSSSDSLQKPPFLEILTHAMERLPDMPNVSRLRTKYQYVDKALVSRPRMPPVLTVFMNGHFQFNARQERIYHESMVHVPIAATKFVPRNVLVLGAGDGLLIRELLKYGPEIEKITLVELDSDVVASAQSDPDFLRSNQNSLNNAKVSIVIDDALHFLRRSRAAAPQWDAIFIDFPYPYQSDLTKLYSVEFYRFVRRRLVDGGFAVINAPLYPRIPSSKFPDRNFHINSVILSTVSSSGFSTVQPFEVAGQSFAIALPEKKRLNIPDMTFRDVPLNVLFDKRLVPQFDRDFPHAIDGKFVNSIFKPTIENMVDLAF